MTQHKVYNCVFISYDGRYKDGGSCWDKKFYLHFFRVSKFHSGRLFETLVIYHGILHIWQN